MRPFWDVEPDVTLEFGGLCTNAGRAHPSVFPLINQITETETDRAS